MKRSGESSMTILALEFSSEQRSVAVARGQTVSEIVETGGRSTAAFGMIEKVLADAGLEREQIDAVAVGIGPGSYTGIRSAIAIAQGWRLARPIRLIGVSSIETIAAQARQENIQGQVDVVIDAQRGEIYHARYEISATAVKEIGALQIVGPDKLGGNSLIVGPEATRWFPSGRVIFPRAATLARLALDVPQTTEGKDLEPIYLRQTTFVKAPAPRVVP